MDVIVGSPISSDPVENIQLTEQEEKDAIYEGKKRKFFHERNKDKWPEEESENRSLKKHCK
jgi:hypothetical protein